jgi:hypothetical protein
MQGAGTDVEGTQTGCLDQRETQDTLDKDAAGGNETPTPTPALTQQAKEAATKRVAIACRIGAPAEPPIGIGVPNGRKENGSRSKSQSQYLIPKRTREIPKLKHK